MRRVVKDMVRAVASVVLLASLFISDSVVAQSADIVLEVVGPPPLTKPQNFNTLTVRFINNGPDEGSTSFNAILGPRDEVPIRFDSDSIVGGCGFVAQFFDGPGLPYGAGIGSPLLMPGESAECEVSFLVGMTVTVTRFEFVWERSAIGINDPNPDNNSTTVSFGFIIPAAPIPALSPLSIAFLIMGFVGSALLVRGRFRTYRRNPHEKTSSLTGTTFRGSD